MNCGELAFGTQMTYLAFLLAIMVFAADPMAPSLVPGAKGEGLSPLLQHPAMLIHPPIVFLGYAAWGVPFALAAAALISGRLDNAWLQQARPWSLFAWTTLGGGILLGAEWAYEQLGWGGYWAWDPVENGSLMPWLTGTALIHGLMTWRQGAFKKTTLFLAIATFGLCNFATFLTRSGIFSSLHAFSQSPIGWMFLIWIAAFVVGGTVLILRRKKQLAAEKPLAALWSREALVLLGILALVLLTTVTLLGTLAGAISGLFSATPIMVGLAFYNNVLIPTGLVLLAVVAAVPLIRWGAGPTRGRVACWQSPPSSACSSRWPRWFAASAVRSGWPSRAWRACCWPRRFWRSLRTASVLGRRMHAMPLRGALLVGLCAASPQLRRLPHPPRLRLHGGRHCRLVAGKPRDRSLHDPRPDRRVGGPHDPLRRPAPSTISARRSSSPPNLKSTSRPGRAIRFSPPRSSIARRTNGARKSRSIRPSAATSTSSCTAAARPRRST